MSTDGVHIPVRRPSSRPRERARASSKIWFILSWVADRPRNGSSQRTIAMVLPLFPPRLIHGIGAYSLSFVHRYADIPICLGFACSFLGRSISSTPSFILAVTFSGSTEEGSVKER